MAKMGQWSLMQKAISISCIKILIARATQGNEELRGIPAPPGKDDLCSADGSHGHGLSGAGSTSNNHINLYLHVRWCPSRSSLHFLLKRDLKHSTFMPAQVPPHSIN